MTTCNNIIKFNIYKISGKYVLVSWLIRIQRLFQHKFGYIVPLGLPYFPDYKPRLFFQKFQGSGLYTGATYVRTFPKKTCTIHCTLGRASIST